MKNKLLFTGLCCMLLAACQTKKTPTPIGGGFNVVCECYKDTANSSFNLGDKYTPYDTLGVMNPYYTDSCNKLRTAHGYDSSHVWVATL